MGVIPVFIGGFRSGTTLLVNLLGQHPDLRAWFETKELCEALRWLKVLTHPEDEAFETALVSPPAPPGFDLAAVEARMRQHMEMTWERIRGTRQSGKGEHERYPLGNDLIDYSLDEALALLSAWRNQVGAAPGPETVSQATAALIHNLAGLQCRDRPGMQWINKTPEITRFAVQLRSTIGSCRIIYMVRDGLDVVASARKLGWGNAGDLAYKWEGLLRETRQAMQGHTRSYLELRYEALLRNPARELDRIFALCDVEPLGEKIVAAFRRQAGPDAFTAKAGSGRELLTQEEKKEFQIIAGALQASLGYPLN